MTRLGTALVFCALVLCIRPARAYDLVTATTQTEKAGDNSTLVGKLPASVQWYYEKPASFFYLGYNTLQLASNHLVAGKYDVVFDSPALNFFSFNYFSNLFRGDTVEKQDWWRTFGLWMRYSLGGTFRDGQISTSDFNLSASSATSNLVAGFATAGLQFQYDRWGFFHPYFGAQLLGLVYRHSAPASGAEAQGTGLGYEPVAGAHFVIPGTQISAFGEARWTSPLSGNTIAIVSSGANVSTGLGLTF